MNFSQAFELWRPLGVLRMAAISALPRSRPSIHYVHRLFAYAVLGVLVVLAWRLRCDTAAQADTIAQARQRQRRCAGCSAWRACNC